MAVSALLLCSGVCRIGAETVHTVVGTTNAWVGLDGCTLSLPQGEYYFDIQPGASVSYGAGGSSNSLVIAAGQVLGLYMGQETAFIRDETQFCTFWFWSGVIFTLGIGLLSLGARWVSKTIGGGWEE